MTRDREMNGEGDELDRRLDDVLRDLRESYNAPPAVPPLESMWANIECSMDAAKVVELRGAAPSARIGHARRYTRWVGLAAALVVGVAIGRVSAPTISAPAVATLPSASPALKGSGGSPITRPSGPERTAPDSTVSVAAARPEPSRPVHSGRSQIIARSPATQTLDDSGLAHEYTGGPDRYLVQATALLIGLTSDAPRPGEDVRLALRAGELLTTTRLMLDAPTTNAKTRELLLDLELVLTQVVRLQSESGRQELRLIREALEQRELLPRLHSAVASGTGD